MKQDTRNLGMAAAVWAIAAIVVLALGRVDVPAGLIASDDDRVPLARSIEATVSPADDIPDRGHRRRGQELAVADRVPVAEADPLIRLPDDDKHPGSEPRAAVSPAERHPLPTATARATSLGGGPASGHGAKTDPRAADVSSEPGPQPPEAKPQPTEAKPDPTDTKLKPKPQPTEAKPKPKPQPTEAKPKPKPGVTKPLEPTEAKPQPTEEKPKPKPEPSEAKPKPNLAKPGSAQPKHD
ncbi:MAG: hypothetical protein AB1Z66_01840 [Candidatus Limnocylindrales bacterium]